MPFRLPVSIIPGLLHSRDTHATQIIRRTRCSQDLDKATVSELMASLHRILSAREKPQVGASFSNFKPSAETIPRRDLWFKMHYFPPPPAFFLRVLRIILCGSVHGGFCINSASVNRCDTPEHTAGSEDKRLLRSGKGEGDALQPRHQITAGSSCHYPLSSKTLQIIT